MKKTRGQAISNSMTSQAGDPCMKIAFNYCSLNGEDSQPMNSFSVLSEQGPCNSGQGLDFTEKESGYTDV